MTQPRQHNARHPDPSTVIGPYSLWPRKAQKSWRKPAILAATAASAAIFVHCAVPVML